MALLVPKIIRKIDKMKLFRICVVATILLSFLIIPARSSFILFVITFMLRAVPLGVVGVLSFTFTPDCAEYGQYTTGTEAKGITFAIQTFAVKLAAAISGSMGLALLGWFGFKTKFMVDGVQQEVSSFADLDRINAVAQQTSEALDGLWFTYNIVPIIGLVIAAVIWGFYKLNDKDAQVMADCNVGKITKEEAGKLLSKKY
jgi:Na+/melibiose symporter-like transporter